MRLMKKTPFPFLTAMFFSALSAMPSYAANSSKVVDPDQEQPIEITADQLQFHRDEGYSVYSGHVRISQGTLKLTGDKVILKHPNQKLQTAHITGRPATFKKFLADQQRWIKGQANTIDYDAVAQTLLLTGNAEVHQGDQNIITGPQLRYNLEKHTLQAQQMPNEKQRIHVILQPENAKTTQNQPGAR